MHVSSSTHFSAQIDGFLSNHQTAKKALDGQLRRSSLLDMAHVCRQPLLQNSALAAVSVDDLDGPADVQAGIQHAVDLVPYGLL